MLRRLPAQHGRDALEPRVVDVVQHEVVDADDVAPGQQRPVEQWDAEAAAADDRELHGHPISSLWYSRKVASIASAGSPGSCSASTSAWIRGVITSR